MREAPTDTQWRITYVEASTHAREHTDCKERQKETVVANIKQALSVFRQPL